MVNPGAAQTSEPASSPRRALLVGLDAPSVASTRAMNASAVSSGGLRLSSYASRAARFSRLVMPTEGQPPSPQQSGFSSRDCPISLMS